MNAASYLITYKSQLKQEVIKDLDLALELLQTKINPGSSLKNDLYILIGRYHELEEDTRKGVIDYKDRTLTRNIIRENILDLIDRLRYEDIEEQEDAVFMEYAKETPLDSEAHPVPLQQNNTLAPLDLEIFIEKHKSYLTFYPRIYRKARELIIRNLTTGPEVESLISTITAHQSDLENVSQKLGRIEAQVKKIYLYPEGREYKLTIDRLREKRTQLEADNLKEIGSMSQKVEQLFENLLQRGILSQN